MEAKRNKTKKKSEEKLTAQLPHSALTADWHSIASGAILLMEPATRTCDRVNMSIKRQYFSFDDDDLRLGTTASKHWQKSKHNMPSTIDVTVASCTLCSIAFHSCKSCSYYLQFAHE